MNFSNLRISTSLLNALEDLGIVYPTPIQEKSFPKISSGKDLVGIARTGTGKTFAYLLPILDQLKFSYQKQARVLIIAPTRELVCQVKEEAEKLCKYKTVRIKAIYGGVNINTQKKEIYNEGLDIIVGTPGRVFDLAVAGFIKFNSIKKIVIDEVDEMLSLGFRPQLEQIIEMINNKHQNLMFSATLSEDVKTFILKYFNSPEIIEVEQNNFSLDSIDQQVYFATNFNTKINFLKSLLENKESFKKNIVFVSNKKQADYLYDKLKAELSDEFKDSIGVIHSNKSQNFRFNSIKDFESGAIKTLIATDLVARGLDFTDISHVINLSPPEQAYDYTHRIGRTARADKTGTAISMISEYEKDYYIAIKNLYENEITEYELPEGVEISKTILDYEKPASKQKQYLKTPDTSKSGKAFHTKKAKNMKTNSGGLRGKSNRKKR